jgi:quercetin dioxygenase-like cupin family protein
MSNIEVIKTDNVLARIMSLKEDASTEWHYHTETKDFIVCLTGRILVESRTPVEVYILHPGERAEIYARQVHRVVNVYKEKSEYLLIQGVGRYDFIPA